ncbi:hypothetical protein V6N13_014249 [Hibiscus sabdariffa]
MANYLAQFQTIKSTCAHLVIAARDLGIVESEHRRIKVKSKVTSLVLCLILVLIFLFSGQRVIVQEKNKDKIVENLVTIQAAASSAVKTTGKLIAKEASYLRGVKQKVDDLQTDLQWMKNFLSSEEVRQAAGDGTIHLQAAVIRELVYDAEDVVETFDLKIVPKWKPGFTNRIKRYACILHEGWMLHKIGSEIDKITGKKLSLKGRLETFQPNQPRGGGGGGSSSSTDMMEKRRPFPHVIDENTVGLDDDIEKLDKILMDEGSECRVVSICGTGGLGKTTLAKKIYQREEKAGHFQHLAFVYVSKVYQRERVWEDILSSLPCKENGDSELSVQQLAEKLFKLLEENKCLVVLDDIWDVEAWNDLKPAFSFQGNSKSKILFTSRNKEIASHADGRGYAYELPRLTDEESWHLFQKITFPLSNNPEYKKLGKEMVRSCPKLPLAIIALGGILAKKKNSLSGWQQVSDNVKSFLRDTKVKELKLEEVLALSYDDLPCIVPPKQEGEIAEDVTEGYLMELAERFMILPQERDVATLKITTFQVHDEMRLLCLSKAEQENFVFIVDESNASSLSTVRKVGRVSMHRFFGTQYIRCPNLRPLSFFNTHSLRELFEVETPLACITGPFSGLSCFWYDLAACIRFLKAWGFWTYIFTNLKLLRVLNYEGRPTHAGCKLMGDIGNLIHLRFLSLKGFKFKGSKLPSSLGNLRCLLSLDLRLHGFGHTHVPDVIWRMEQLRHLYLPYYYDDKTKLHLGTLRNLLTLVNFNTKNCYLKDLINMTNLRELVISGAFEIKRF